LTVEELRIDADGTSLAVSWTPAGDAAIVALHGASEGTRDFFLYEHLHATLPPRGIGVATFDRRGDGASTGDSSRGRFELQARDALAVRDALPVGRAGLWGFSQGAWSAPLAATLSERVDFLVLVGSAGVTPAEQMHYATASQLALAGYGDDVVARALELRRRFEAHVHGADDAELAGDLLAGLDEPWWGLAFLPPATLDDEGRRAWIDEMDFDPVPVFSGVRVPTLCFYGAADSWLPVDESAAVWRSLEAYVVVIDGAEHDLTFPDGTLAPAYEETLADWLSRVASSTAS
jgi:pimeloyl-ACP methyl ester carboxylesterase